MGTNNVERNAMLKDLVDAVKALSPQDRLKLFTLKLFHEDGRPVKLKKKHLPAPWLGDDLKAMLDEKKAAKARLKTDYSEQALENYKTIRNRCNMLCRDAQKRYNFESDGSTKVWIFHNSLKLSINLRM